MDTNATNDIAENYSGNPPVIETPIGAIAEAIHQRILAEQQKLHVEEKSERDLTTKRIALLTEGSDAEVDGCELAIDQSRTAQLRSLERIELLAEQLRQANRAAETQRLDVIAAGAERARIEGEKIIRTEYVKAANALAAVLAKLKEKDEVIDAANPVLEKHKRPAIASPNSIRCRSAEQFEWTERKLVTAGDPAHPRFANAERVPNTGNLPPVYRDRTTRELIQPVEAEVHHSTYVPGDYAEALYKTVTLPAATPAPRAYVHANGKQLMYPDIATPIWQGEIKTGFFPL